MRAQPGRTWAASGIAVWVATASLAAASLAQGGCAPPPPSAPPPRGVDIDADTNRDGSIDGDDDEGEDAFLDAHGAVFLSNVDDDNGDGVRDSRDDAREGSDDDADLTTLLVHRGPLAELAGAGVAAAAPDASSTTPAHTDARTFLRIAPQIAARRIRVWNGDAMVHDPNGDGDEDELSALGDDEIALQFEALTGRTDDWDGRVMFTLEVRDGSDILGHDEVQLRAAPVLFPDNLQAPERVYVVDIPVGDDNNRALVGALRDGPGLPAGATLQTADGDTYEADRWIQDNMELGVQVVPSSSSSGVHLLRTAMQMQRSYGGEGLETYVPDEYLRAGAGFFFPGGDDTSHNYGGNCEVSPPTTQDPLGHMLYGGGTTTLSGRGNPDTMNDAQVAFLRAQEAQGDPLELSSEWLAVGHIDEIFQFIPVLEPAPGRPPFAVVIASPDLAFAALEALAGAGRGDAVAFSGRSASYTVQQMLDAADFGALNDAAQARIDGVQQTMQSALGLSDDDFLRVPVLYDEADSFGLVAAFNPGIQNLVTTGDRVFVPDPEGPHDGNDHDVWQEATRAALAPTGLDVVFVDVFASYHELLGEAHCGTNVDRTPYATAWWSLPQ